MEIYWWLHNDAINRYLEKEYKKGRRFLQQFNKILIKLVSLFRWKQYTINSGRFYCNDVKVGKCLYLCSFNYFWIILKISGRPQHNDLSVPNLWINRHRKSTPAQIYTIIIFHIHIFFSIKSIFLSTFLLIIAVIYWSSRAKRMSNLIKPLSHRIEKLFLWMQINNDRKLALIVKMAVAVVS